MISIGAFDFGIIPILAVILSVIGLATHRSGEQTGQTYALIGLLLGLAYTFAYLNRYGHLGL